MKETLWLHVPKTNRQELSEWNEYYKYDTIDDKLGPVIAYSITTDNYAYFSLINRLQSRRIPYEVFRREYKFTKKEIDNAEILKLIIDGNAGESYSPEHEGNICPECGEEVPKQDINDLHVDYKQIKQYDISVTYMGDTEIIVSQKLKDLLSREGITGICFSPVFQLGKENEIIPNYYHLKLEVGIGEVVQPAIVDKDEKCCECGFYRKFLCQTPLYFEKGSWNGLDISYTDNWFGSPPRSQGKWVIISPKLYRVLKDNKVKLFSVEPAFLIEK